ncbi:acrosin-like [Tripterygium wilfordii]|uniref:acrosin-like n=1 Tax=Tripterygium wilfordii TaxID=458696 RepID=UPI0018F83E36|nr:acrosin-like [Tripterygium wilfordii]
MPLQAFNPPNYHPQTFDFPSSQPLPFNSASYLYPLKPAKPSPSTRPPPVPQPPPVPCPPQPPPHPHSPSTSSNPILTMLDTLLQAPDSSIFMVKPENPSTSQTTPPPPPPENPDPPPDLPPDPYFSDPESLPGPSPPISISRPSSSHSFTLDDIPPSKWKERLDELFAWCVTQLQAPQADTATVINRETIHFTGRL